jgi:hypothetical protein
MEYFWSRRPIPETCDPLEQIHRVFTISVENPDVLQSFVACRGKEKSNDNSVVIVPNPDADARPEYS